MLRGAQQPRVLHRPPFATEASGIEAIELARAAGLDLMPWQELAVRVALAEREDGLWAAREFAELVSRQNGKGGVLEAIVLHGMFIVRDPLTLWTAHQFKTAEEAFLRMRALVDGSDFLRRRVKSISTANGDEGIELYGGVRLRFIARSKASGRGMSPQRIIWDEAQELSRLAFQALAPAVRAQVNPQHVYAGTVPGPEVNNPEHWTGLRDRGRAGTGKRLAWMEWTPVGSDDPVKAAKLDLDSRRVWAEGNPSLGYLLTEETLEGDRESMRSDPEGFSREAVSIWPTELDSTADGVLDLDRWGALKNAAAAEPAGGVIYVDVSPDRRTASLGLAAQGSTAEKILVLTFSAAGTAWVVPRLVELVAAKDVSEVVLCRSHQAGGLIPDLVAEGVEFTEIGITEVGQATAAFIAGVNETGRYEHVGQAELDRAVGNATTKFNGEAEVWDRRDRRVDISALVAAAGAAFRFAQFNDYDPLDSVG